MAEEEVVCPYCRSKMKASQMGSGHFLPCNVKITDPDNPKKQIKCNSIEHAGCTHR